MKTPTDFLEALYADAEGWVTVSGINGTGAWKDGIKSARIGADLTGVLCDRETDRWFRVQPQSSKYGRGEPNTASVVTLIADFDFPGSSNNKKLAPFDNLDDVARFCNEHVPVEVSAVVSSGHGAHAYWFLEEPLTPAEGKDLLVRFDLYLRQRAKGEGKQLDPIQDLARVFRMPGSINAKHPEAPVSVSVESLYPDRRYSVDDFDWLPEAQPTPEPQSGVPELVDVEIPEWLEHRIRAEDGNGDRSMEQVYVVHACLEAGLSIEQTWAAVHRNPATVDKWGGRTDWRRNFDKIVAKHDQAAHDPETASTDGIIQPVDLQGIIDGGLERVEPDVFWRRDARALFYRKKLNVVFGAPEAGKTWVGLIAAVDLVTDAARTGRGVVVVYFDFEDDATTFLTRMRDAGADLEHVVEHSRYYSLTSPIQTLPQQYEGSLTADLVVIDTTNSAMTLDGLDPLSNKDALTFINHVRSLREGSDAAWVLLDHEPISSGAGRRQAIGAQSKLGAVDGAQYRAVAVEQPRPGAKGAIALYLTKDRPGGVRQHAAKPDEHGIQHAATVFMDPNIGTTSFRYEVIEPQGVEGDALLRAAIIDVCTDWCAKGQIEQLVRGKRLKRRGVAIRKMIEDLAAEGVLEQAPKGNYVVYKTAVKGVVQSRDDRDDHPSSGIGTTEHQDDHKNVDTAGLNGSSDDLGTTGTTTLPLWSSRVPPLGGTTGDGRPSDELPIPYSGEAK